MSVHTGRVMNRADFEHEVALGFITKEDKVELLAVTVHGAGTVVTALAFPELELVPLE